MNDCPLCRSQFLEGYEHIDYPIIICARCYSQFKQLKTHRKFTRFSFLSSTLSKETKQANQKLKEYITTQKKLQKDLIDIQMFSECFQIKSEKTQRFSLTTEDTQQFLEPVLTTETTKSEFTLQKCQEKVMEIASKLEPAKEKIKQTTQALKQKADTLKEKYLNFKLEYRNLKAELPEMKGLARQARNKLSSFFKLF